MWITFSKGKPHTKPAPNILISSPIFLENIRICFHKTVDGKQRIELSQETIVMDRIKIHNVWSICKIKTKANTGCDKSNAK